MSSIQHDVLTDEGLAALGVFDLSEDVAGPIMAGLRAQSVARLCERLNLPAILLDGRGRVLHVSPIADTLMAGDVATVADHLLGGDVNANRRIEKLLVASLADEPTDHVASVSIVSRAGREPLILTAIRAGTASVHQLLKVVVVATRGVEVGRQAVLDVCAALAQA